VLVVVEGHQDEVEALASDALHARVAGLGADESIARWSDKDTGTLVVMVPETAPSVTVTVVKPTSVRVATHP
jgi:hypothetical protein